MPVTVTENVTSVMLTCRLRDLLLVLLVFGWVVVVVVAAAEAVAEAEAVEVRRAEEEDEALVSLDTISEDSVREMFDLVSGSKVVSTLSTKFICNARAVQCCFSFS